MKRKFISVSLKKRQETLNRISEKTPKRTLNKSVNSSLMKYLLSFKFTCYS